MNRRAFFLKTLQATAAGILVPEHLLKGRSMVSLCGIDFGGGSVIPITATNVDEVVGDMLGRIALYGPTEFPLARLMRNLEKV